MTIFPRRAAAPAVAGAACISSSAVVMQLAGSSPSATALGRCGFALPVLGLLAWLERRRGGAGTMTARARWLARIAGVFLAADLIVWSHSIADIGAGLGTVVTNLQVVIVALLGWLVLGERPRPALLVALPLMFGGLVLVGGLASTGGYGRRPELGVAFGAGVAVLYAVYILMLRQAAVGSPVVATLFEATLGAAVASLVLGLLLRDFRLGPAWPALGWLLLLALTSQVIGWLLITVSMPRLPAWLVSALLLVQPAGSLALGAVFLGERPSPLQLAGVAAMLGGVLVEWTSWRAVFLVNVPVGLAAACLAPRVIAATPREGGQRKRLDVRGAVLITATVTLAVFGISQGDVLGWTSPLVIGAAVIAVAAAGGFVAAETRHPAPLVRPGMLLRPGLRNGAALAFLLGVWTGGELLVLSLYMQQALHFSPLVTGLIIAPQGVAGFSMGLLGPKLAGRFGIRRVAMIAGVSATAGFAALTRLPADGYSPLLFVVTLVGFGGAGTAFGSIVLASRELADGDQGLAGGVVNTSRQIGAAVGAALLPAIADSVSGVSGDRAAMLTATVAALTATAVAWRAARQAGAAAVRSA